MKMTEIVIVIMMIRIRIRIRTKITLLLYYYYYHRCRKYLIKVHLRRHSIFLDEESKFKKYLLIDDCFIFCLFIFCLFVWLLVLFCFVFCFLQIRIRIYEQIYSNASDIRLRDTCLTLSTRLHAWRKASCNWRCC